MSLKTRNITYIIAIITLIIVAIVYEKSFFNELSSNTISKQSQRYITTKSNEINNLLLEVCDDLVNEVDIWNKDYGNEFIIFVRSYDSIKYWNTNRISPENIPYTSSLSCKSIDNAWFLYKSIYMSHYRIDVLKIIKNNYPIDNEYFNSNEIHNSELSHYDISDTLRAGYISVLDEGGVPIFYINRTKLNEHNLQHSQLSSVLYIILFLTILIFLSAWHKNLKICILSVVIFAAGFIGFIHFFEIIPVFYFSKIFTYRLYLTDNYSCNIGMLSMCASLWIVLCYTATRPLLKSKSNRWKAIGLCVFLLITFFIIVDVYTYIINNSSITLQFYRIRRLESESLWLFLVFILFFSGWVRFAFTAVTSFASQRKSYLNPLIAIALCSPLLFRYLDSLLFAVFVLLTIDLVVKKREQLGQFKFISLLSISILLSFMTTFVAEHNSRKKNEREMKELLHNLPTSLILERDFVIEEYLVDIWNEMKDDKILADISQMIHSSADFYTNYLRNRYFSDQLKNYDMQVVVCSPYNNLIVEGASSTPNCYEFFEDRLNKQGERIKDTGFYWQKNNNGRVSYFGWFKILADTYMETSIMVELESPIISEGRGYPEMLRDGSSVYSSVPKYSSFARYADGKLINSIGTYNYPHGDKWLGDLNKKFTLIDFDRKTHYCRLVSQDNYVIISEEKVTIMHSIYAYIYNFLMFFLSFFIIHIITQKYQIKYKHTISNNIRITMTSLLLISFLLVGTISIFYPINLHKQNQQAILTEKGDSFQNSISRELLNVSDIKDVSKPLLQNLLLSLSNTLSNDVHIYDLDGRLYTSSRPQLFDNNLQSKLMSPRAYRAFEFDNLSSYVHQEQIGNNIYKSIYYTLSNIDEEPIAYINVPFFSSQKNLQRNITDLIVLLFNIYLVIIFFVIIFTYIFVSSITKPLNIIQVGLEKMRLGSNEKIEYSSSNELGELVKKYNVMVDELNASASQLAKSEREVAWKSMARQIAHEIKNPLTPMKLSIQHLARTKQLSPEAFSEYFDKTANTLIGQIDNLSSIATSFSTFAKISDGVLVPISINKKLSDIVTLFEQSGSKICYEALSKEFIVQMDKDHFRQIFNNLIKNALQAIPDDVDGKICICSEVHNGMIYINVIDNGVGISDEMQEKIFQPNFTTKNSGMGLGLAISQKMANNAGGNITFISKEGKGTTFIVSLPIDQQSSI